MNTLFLEKLNRDELGAFVRFLESSGSELFFGVLSGEKGKAINSLITENNEQVRGKIKAFGEVTRWHDIALEMIREIDAQTGPKK